MPDVTPQPPPLPAHPLQYPAPSIPPPHAFTPDHVAAIAEARNRFAPIRRQIAVARFDAWSVAIFAGLTLLFGFTSLPALLVGLGMVAIAFVEFRAITQLRNLDPAAPRTLALNQLAFAAILILYAAYNLFFPGAGLSSEVQQALSSDPQLASTATGLVSMISRILYLGVIAFALIFQGGCALYHFTRIPLLRRYLDTTAPWLLQLHSAGVMN